MKSVPTTISIKTSVVGLSARSFDRKTGHHNRNGGLDFQHIVYSDATVLETPKK